MASHAAPVAIRSMPSAMGGRPEDRRVLAVRASRIAAFLGAIAAAIVGGAPRPAQAGWGIFYVPVARPTAPPPPDQSWLQDLAESPSTHARGRVAVFVFRGDDLYEPVRAAVVRSLRRKGLNVTAKLRPVDTTAQYREMSYALNLAVYIHGEMKGEGPRQSAWIHLYSGVTGQRIASAKFPGPMPKIIAAIDRGLWNQTGRAITRACASASRPRQREREPLRIEAGTPLGNTASDDQGT